MLSRTFGRLAKQDVDPKFAEQTLLNVFASAQDLASNIQKVQFQMPMSLIGREYPEIYKRLGDINVAGAINLADEIIKNSNPGDSAQRAAKTWKRYFDNRLFYINRLQASEWLELFEKAGFELVHKKVITSELDGLKVHNDFENYSIEDKKCHQLVVVHRKN